MTIYTFFHDGSVGRKAIDKTNAQYVTIKDALFGEATNAPSRVGFDIVELIIKDTSFAAVDVFKSVAFSGSSRRAKDTSYDPAGLNGAGTGAGAKLLSFQCDRNAGRLITRNYDGNAHGGLIDLDAGTSFDMFGMHRASPGGDFLTAHPMYSWSYVNIATGAKAANGAGFYNDGIGQGSRASGFSGLMCVLQEGEIASGTIAHPLVFAMPQRRLSANVAHVWPARGHDSYYADGTIGYAGPNDDYTMGTLMAIHPSVNVNNIRTEYGNNAGRKLTSAGKVLAKNAQDYGWYVGDATGTPGTGLIQVAATAQCAAEEFGYVYLHGEPSSPYTKTTQTYHRALYNLDDVSEDILAIFNYLMAVRNNYANFGRADPGPAPAYVA